MSPKELRVFALGYRCAMQRARRELDAMARRWDQDLAELDDRMRTAHQQTVQRIGDELVGLMGEMEGVKNEFRRWQAVERAIVVERDFDELLN